MNKAEHAYHLVYDTSGKVLDHSELYFADLPNRRWLRAHAGKLRSKLEGWQLAILQHEAELIEVFCQQLLQMEYSDSFEMEGHRFQIHWQLRGSGIGVLTINEDGRTAGVDLLLSGQVEDDEQHEPSSDATGELELALAVNRLLPGSVFERSGALKLIRVTRRPLLVAVSWPPVPGNDSPLRRLERMVAYAFFRGCGAVR
jgi:hypothetical protein